MAGNKYLVSAVNNPPQFADSTGALIQTLHLQTNEDIPLRIHLHVRDADADGLSFTSVTSALGKGTIQSISLSDTSFWYIPKLHTYGIDTVKVIINDQGLPQLYDTLNVIVTIVHVNHSPVILDNGNNPITSFVDSIPGNGTKQICLNAFDIDGDKVVISYIESSPSHGSISGIKDLCLTYQPNNGFVGTDNIGILYCDNGSPVLFNSVTIHLKVFKPNTPPVIKDLEGNHIISIADTTPETVPLKICLNAEDPQNDSIKIYRVLSAGGHLQIDSLDNRKLCFYATPKGSFFGNETLIVVVADNGYPVMYDSLAIHIHVSHVNRAPQFLDPYQKVTDTIYFDAYEKEPMQICLPVSDPEHDRVRITNVLNTSDGMASFSDADSTCLNWISPKHASTIKLIATVCDNGIPSRCNSAVVFIHVLPRFIISQGISPNGDGFNDTWQILGIERHPINTVQIFNQWGNLVYKISGYDNATVVWKGESNAGHLSDNEAPDGTYFYMIELEDGSKLSGFIILKR
jgi:gliding motility-associated-like protein